MTVVPNARSFFAGIDQDPNFSSWIMITKKNRLPQLVEGYCCVSVKFVSGLKLQVAR